MAQDGWRVLRMPQSHEGTVVSSPPRSHVQPVIASPGHAVAVIGDV